MGFPTVLGALVLAAAVTVVLITDEGVGEGVDPVDAEVEPDTAAEPETAAGAGAEAVAGAAARSADAVGGGGSEVEGDVALGAARRLPAFPGAEGHGRFALGGRRGPVVIVDTLEDVIDEEDGRTSLREALQEMRGPRTIVFEVGGTFRTGAEWLLMSGEADSEVTLACQSAPVPGVLILGNGIRIRGGARDIVMRHCAIRNIDPGPELAESSRAVAVIGTSAPAGETSGDMIFDHMSLGWATDENFTVFIGPTAAAPMANFTLSRSIVAEGDADSHHPESGQLPRRYVHAMGPSCNTGSDQYRITGCSIIGNLIANNARRNPMMWGVGGEMLGNVVYNWHETALDARPHRVGRVDLHAHDNLFVAGPTSREGNPPMKLIDEGLVRSNFDVSGNRFVVDGEERALEDVQRGTPDAPVSAFEPFDLDCVGASRPVRDANDARIIAEYLSGTGRVGIGEDDRRDMRGREPASRRPADFDTDRDGIADEWERAHGLDPDDAEDFRRDLDGDGYTALEKYLNELADC